MVPCSLDAVARSRPEQSVAVIILDKHAELSLPAAILFHRQDSIGFSKARQIQQIVVLLKGIATWGRRMQMSSRWRGWEGTQYKMFRLE